MRKTITVLVLALVLLLSSAFYNKGIASEDCFVEILSITLEKSTFEVGEALEVNFSYTLFYDILDPLATGSVIVSITPENEAIPIFSCEFLEMGIGLSNNITTTLSPDDWTPETSGQIGTVKVEGWVQDSYGSRYDSATQTFTVIRSYVHIAVNELPDPIKYHDQVVLSGNLTNHNNQSIMVRNHPYNVSLLDQTTTIQTWNNNSTSSGNFSIVINTTQIGIGVYSCNISPLSSEDYLQSSIEIPFNITSADLTIEGKINKTTIYTYYPSLENCSISINVNVSCSASTHSVSTANVTWMLANQSGNLVYANNSQFTGVAVGPSIPGTYNLTIVASLVNHSATSIDLPLDVMIRTPIISLTANSTSAAFGSFVELSATILDSKSSKPVIGKSVTIFVLNHSQWLSLAQLITDQNGIIQTVWQAFETGSDDKFIFKVTLHGSPEFLIADEFLNITNTGYRNVLYDSISNFIRGQIANYSIRITTIDDAPLSNLTVILIETLPNITHATAITDSMGFANLSWLIDISYDLGEYDFHLVIIEDFNVIAIIDISIVVFDTTVITLIG
jgi:5-hydroxyisourate hydrolase-like protein (transthyretin family)